MDKVFIVHHVREDPDGYENIKLIGVYSTETKASEVVDRFKSLPGFVDYPNGFDISKYDIDKDDWSEGFVDIDE